jgi:hypothetical protein
VRAVLRGRAPLKACLLNDLTRYRSSLAAPGGRPDRSRPLGAAATASQACSGTERRGAGDTLEGYRPGRQQRRHRVAACSRGGVLLHSGARRAARGAPAATAAAAAAAYIGTALLELLLHRQRSLLLPHCPPHKAQGCSSPAWPPAFPIAAGATMVRGPKKHMKRLNAPSHWMLDKLGGIFVSLAGEGL